MNNTPIQLLILDVDGVLTDGMLYYTSEGEAMKTFYTQDGLGLRMLQAMGIHVAIITGRTSGIVQKRAEELGIARVYQGQVNKVAAFKDCIAHFNVPLAAVAYMGDDVNDLPLMKKVGLAAAPPNAVPEVLEIADIVTTRKGGKGAVREIVNHILRAQDLFEKAMSIYAE
jgi:3-deoxy-D-manno-octulosonate 8-phosphate phosphatase (KDO 8-P phosphatase)